MVPFHVHIVVKGFGQFTCILANNTTDLDLNKTQTVYENIICLCLELNLDL
jgi:hypothetical protein